MHTLNKKKKRTESSSNSSKPPASPTLDFAALANAAVEVGCLLEKANNYDETPEGTEARIKRHALFIMEQISVKSNWIKASSKYTGDEVNPLVVLHYCVYSGKNSCDIASEGSLAIAPENFTHEMAQLCAVGWQKRSTTHAPAEKVAILHRAAEKGSGASLCHNEVAIFSTTVYFGNYYGGN